MNDIHDPDPEINALRWLARDLDGYAHRHCRHGSGKNYRVAVSNIIDLINVTADRIERDDGKTRVVA